MKISKLGKMIILFILCIALSAFSLHTWAGYGPLTIGSYLSSALIHIVVPMFLLWAVLYRKIQTRGGNNIQTIRRMQRGD